ncbi:MAG: DUF1854 domain-containing protein, partial [bacterium]
PLPGVDQALAEAAQLRVLDPLRLRFFKSGATLRLTIEGEYSVLKVVILRAFPLTFPQQYYSLRDGSGKDLGLIVNPGALEPESRRLVEADIERRYMTAVVRRIHSVTERFGTVDWEVETHRGTNRFTTRDLRDNVLRPTPVRVIFTDVAGNRYEIPDLNALDPKSQSWLLRHL